MNFLRRALQRRRDRQWFRGLKWAEDQWQYMRHIALPTKLKVPPKKRDYFGHGVADYLDHIERLRLVFKEQSPCSSAGYNVGSADIDGSIEIHSTEPAKSADGAK